MSNTSIPEHVFISYAHADKEFVEKLETDLEKAGIPVWIDRTGLEPGTRNWEETIRDAISCAFAVLLIASPNSIQSDYVPDELNVAHGYNRRVYPILMAGEDWNSIPLGRGRIQHIDCRDAQYETGLSQLVKTLKDVIDNHTPKLFPFTNEEKLPRGYFSIKLDEQTTIAARASSYQSLGSLEDDLYKNYLAHQGYHSLTYGREWIIASTYKYLDKYFEPHVLVLLIAPWDWLENAHRNQRIRSLDREWSASSLETYGLVADTYWQIVGLPVPAFGIATNYPEMMRISHDKKLSMALKDLLGEVVDQDNEIYEDYKTTVTLVSPEAVSPRGYKYLLVLTFLQIVDNRTKYDGKVFIIEQWSAL